MQTALGGKDINSVWNPHESISEKVLKPNRTEVFKQIGINNCFNLRKKCAVHFHIYS